MITLTLTAVLALTSYSVAYMLAHRPTGAVVWLTVAATTYRVDRGPTRLATIERRV